MAKLFVSSLVGFAMLNVMLSMGADAAPSKQSWVLVQTSQLHGNITVVITPTALKATARDFTVITCAPTWKVCVYNSRSQMFETPLATWAETGLAPLWGPKSSKDRFDLDKMTISRTCTICDLPCKCIETRSHGKKTPQSVPGLSKFGQELKDSTWAYSETCLTQQIKPVPQFRSFLRGLRKTGEWSNAVVMRTVSTYTSGKKIIEMDTISCRRQEVPASQLKYPPSTYKKVSRVEDVIQSQSARQSIEDIFSSVSDLGVVRSPPKDEKGAP